MAMTTAAAPTMHSAMVWAFNATMSTSVVTPAPAPTQSAIAVRRSMRPPRSRLTVTKVAPAMLWVMAPATSPQSTDEAEFFVQRFAALRMRVPVNALRFSVSVCMPT